VSFPRYPEYKDSGVEWLGEVPAHWRVAALNFRYEVLLGKMLDEKRVTGRHLAPYLRNVDVQWDRINIEDLPQMDFSGDDIERYGLRPGDLLVCEGGEVGRSAIWAAEVPECYYQKALHRLRARRPLEDVPRFQFYLLRAAVDLGVFTAAEGKSTIAHLTAEALRRYRFAYPAPAEQMVIAAFLDRETAKIDALVAEQEKLIELLKEKRQAVISHAVTKGLDPNVPMKDSGVEWLGEVPAHWAVRPLKHCITSQEGPGIMAADFRDEGIPLLRISCVQSEAVTLEGCNYLDPQKVARQWSHFRVEVGDLLISGSASMGVVSEVGEEAAGAVPYTGLIRLQGRKGGMTKDYIKHLVVSDSFMRQVQLLKTGSTIQHFGPTHLNQMVVVLPPQDEQEAIAQFLNSENRRMESLCAEAAAGMTLLHERRAALISAAVTGQIDVRGLRAEQATATA
jgi:type I restriction enzyme S subunit